MDYNANKKVLYNYYCKNGLDDNFHKDNNYLELAFSEINQLWQSNLNQIREVKYIMIAEAPLWGEKRSYIYNPESRNSQFFYRNDLVNIMDRKLKSKSDFIHALNDIGLIIVDVSPFCLNTENTAVNYRKMTKLQYKNLVIDTLPCYFEQKILAILPKKSPQCKVFFRYARVKKTFENAIADVLIKNSIIKERNELNDISQIGGGINKTKLSSIINNTAQ